MIAEPTTYCSVVRSDCQNCVVAERVAVVLQPDELGMDRRDPGQRAVGQPEVQRPDRRDDEEDADDDRRRRDERERPARAEQVAAGVLAPAATCARLWGRGDGGLSHSPQAPVALRQRHDRL